MYKDNNSKNNLLIAKTASIIFIVYKMSAGH